MPDLFAQPITGRFRPKTLDDSIDLHARKVIVASLLYYRHDQSMMSDTTFDAMCREIASRWKELSPIRQFMLGSARLIRSSGNHVKVTTLAEGAAYAWMRAHRAEPGEVGPISDWQFSDVHQVHWAEVSS